MKLWNLFCAIHIYCEQNNAVTTHADCDPLEMDSCCSVLTNSLWASWKILRLLTDTFTELTGHAPYLVIPLYISKIA